MKESALVEKETLQFTSSYNFPIEATKILKGILTIFVSVVSTDFGVKSELICKQTRHEVEMMSE